MFMKYKKVYARLVISYLIIFTIPLMIDVYVLENIAASTQENICQNVLVNLNHARETVDDNFEEIDTIVQNLTSNSTIRHIALLMDEKQKYIEISRLLSAQDYMKAMRTQSFVEEYYLFLNDTKMVISSDHIFQDDDSARYAFRYDGMEWEEWMGEMGRQYAGYIFPEAETKLNASMTERILYVHSMVTSAGLKGNFVFPIKSEIIKNLLSDTYVSGAGWAYVMDKDGNVLLTIPSETGEFELVPEEHLSAREEIKEVKMNGRAAEIIRTVSDERGLTYVAVLPKEYITVQISQAQKRIIQLMLVVLVLGIASIFGVSWYRGRKIDHILQMLFQTKDGEAEGPKGDEMAYISQSLKQLIENNSDLKDDIRKQEPVIRNLLAERLLRGGIVDKDLSRYGIHLAGRVSFVIAYQIEEQPSEEMEVGTGEAIVYKQVLLRKLEDILCGEQYACDMDIKGGAVICVLREGKDYQKEKLNLSLEKLCVEFWEKDGIKVRMAVGNTCKDVEKISRSYDQIYEMLQYGFVSDKNVLFYEDYLESKDYYYFPVTLEERLVNAVRTGNMESMHEQLREVYQVNVLERDISPSMMHFLVNDLQCTVFKALHSLHDHVEIDEKEISARLEQLNWENDILLRFNRINQIFKYICEKVQSQTNASNIRQRADIERYIQENYRNNDLGLMKIADDFGYASTYFSKLFKELFHENFVNYLEKVRVEKACRLLEQGVRMEDIAVQVGYNSVYVLRSAFKRIKGMTPNDYRKISLGGGKG